MSGNVKWLIPLLLGLQSAFVGSTFTTWAACMFLFCLAAVLAMIHARRWPAGFRRDPLPARIRWLGNGIGYLATGILISGWRFGNYAGESINPMAFGFDAVAHISLVVSLILWVLHPLTGHPAMLGLGLLAVLLSVAAGGASASLTSQIAVALLTTIGFLLGSDLINRGRRRLAQSHGAGGAGVSSSVSAAEPGRIGILFSLITLSVILMTASALAQVTGYMLPNLQTTLHNQLTNTLESIQDQSMIGSSRYVRGSRIGSVRRHMLADPASIALRAHASAKPGYLRGTVFDVYADRRWLAISNDRLPNEMISEQIEPRDLLRSGQGLTRLQGQSSRSLSRFFLYQPDDARIGTIEIHNDPLKGRVVFTPLATRWVEADARYITVSHHNIVDAGISVANPYVCGVAETTKRDKMDTRRRDLLLDIPPQIAGEIGELAKQFASRPTAQAKAAAISNYFQQNFRYSLTEDIPRTKGDPIVQFLRLEHPAHCEYFASATVLLLRAAGVPARYVTGYVANEYSEEMLYWIARNRDAHAWVEAYDDLTGRWFPVESTPGRTYQSLSLTNADSGIFAGSHDGSDDDDDGDDSLLSRAWGWITSMRATDPLYVIFRFGLIPLFCVLAFLLWKSFRGGYNAGASAEDIKSRQMLQRTDRKVKKLALIRQPHETLHQFASRIEVAVNTDMIDRDRYGEFLEQAARWYRQYAAARYRGQLPTPFLR